MEYPEAFHIAQKEVIHIIGEEERERIKIEMRRELIKRKEYQEETKNQNIKRNEIDLIRKQKYSAFIITSAVRKWQSVKRLRENCIENYEKIFDVNSRTFYYRHMRTVCLFCSYFSPSFVTQNRKMIQQTQY